MANLAVAELPRHALESARALLVRACPLDPVGPVAEEKLFGASPPGLVGAAFGAWRGERLVGVAVQAGRWLRLIAVDPEARQGGVGHALLDAAMARARSQGVAKLRVGDQPGNYLGPGVDERSGELLEFLEKRGFQWWGANANLRVPLVDNPLVSAARAAELAAAAADAGFSIRRATPADAAHTLTLAASFSPAWGFEVAQALGNDPSAVFVAIHDVSGTLAGFAAHDGNNRGLGWFGPAGVAPSFRKKGLGAALLLPCLLDVAARGDEQAIIAWIGPRDFYEKVCGAVDDRHFVVMERPL